MRPEVSGDRHDRQRGSGPAVLQTDFGALASVVDTMMSMDVDDADGTVRSLEMPPYRSAPDDLALHGPRVLGFASASRIAERFGLEPGVVHEVLLDHEAHGWVRHTGFAGSSGWSVTDDGRVENERRLAVELDLAGARDAVRSAHAEFVPVNRRFGTACTQWQIRPSRADPLAAKRPHRLALG
jgi:hypothetical protein